MSFIFEWDSAKAQTNLQKHQVSFEEATTIFGDPRLLTFFDEAHSDNEERFISIGISSRLRVLLAVHTERGQRIRIISARKATAQERSLYEHNSST